MTRRGLDFLGRQPVLRGLLGASLIVACGPALAASPYTVGNYPVEATAADAVSAKAQGMADARKAALRYLLKRLVDVSAYKHLPEVPDVAIENLIELVQVRQEQTSNTDYVATLDFGFRPGSIQQLLQRSGLAWFDKQAPLLTIIPVYAAPEGASAPVAVADGQRLWRQAWTGLDLSHALTPVKLAVPGPSATNDVLLKLAAGDRSQLGVIQAESSADKLLVAVATPSATKGKLDVVLIGEDWTGPLALKRRYSLYYDDFSYTSEFAAVVALGVLEGRWKATKGAGLSASAAEPTPWSTSANDDVAAAGPLQPVRFTAQFGSLAEWQQMRGSLGRIAGPQNLQVGAMSSRGAEVTVAYPGGPSALQARLAGEGLKLADAGGRLILYAGN